MNPLSVIRSDALLDRRLQKAPAVYMTLAAITTFTTRAKDGYCYFKQETVAQKLGKTRQAVSQHLNKLAEWGYVEITPQNYRGFKSNNAYRIKYDGEITDASSPCIGASSPCTTTQADLAAKCSSINAIKEKKPLTRDAFMREIDAAYQAGAFKEEFGHLTESEIILQASPCWDWMAVNLTAPEEGKGDVHLRIWLRKGMKQGAIRKVTKESGFQESKPINQEPLTDWQEKIRYVVGEAQYLSWFSKLQMDGDTLIAPSKFHAGHVREHFSDELIAVFGDIHITHQTQTQKEKELCTV